MFINTSVWPRCSEESRSLAGHALIFVIFFISNSLFDPLVFTCMQDVCDNGQFLPCDQCSQQLCFQLQNIITTTYDIQSGKLRVNKPSPWLHVVKAINHSHGSVKSNLSR